MLETFTGFMSDLIYYLPALIIAFTVHEFAHAYTSYKLGDYMVKNDGRVTLNPLKHVDWVGLLMLFFLGFGWAKPVEIHPHLYKNPVRDSALVALAGPLSNFIMAIIGIILNIVFKGTVLEVFFMYLWWINIALGIFNLIPVPPLDGSHILGFFMKADTLRSYLNNQVIGYILIVAIVATNFMSYVLNPIFDLIYNFIY